MGHSDDAIPVPGTGNAAVDGGRHHLGSRWSRALATMLALSLLSAVASITVLLSLSRSLQHNATIVDRKSAMTIDLRRVLSEEIDALHLVIDIGSGGSAQFISSDAEAARLFVTARSTYTTPQELSDLASIRAGWDEIVAPYRLIAANAESADAYAATAAADPASRSELHQAAVTGQTNYEALLDSLHATSRAAFRGELTSTSTLVWGLAGLLAAVFAVSVSASVHFARKMARIVGETTSELQHQAMHDHLTGLPNRALIADRIEQLLARNRRNGTAGAALYIDIDEFKGINDTLGHAVGDQLLQSVASRMTITLRNAETIGRMGGDEFIVLVDGGNMNVAPLLVAERLLLAIREPFVLEGAPTPLLVTTSIGIAIGDRADPADLLRDADVALYQAKAAGRDCAKVFHQDMETALQHRAEYEFDLRSALVEQQFRLVYQPIYTLEDLTLVGVEALVRWDHPTLGEVQPDDFIALLESSGQIVDVGRWVLHEACRHMAGWRAAGSDLTISVNLSARQLDRDGIIDDVNNALAASGLDPASLTLEIAETALMRDVHSAARRLHELKRLGLKIAIDDFGTGYSSLAYLRHFPVDCLKIDRTFTDAINRSPDSKALIHSLVQLGKDLGLRTLAEGVETVEQIDHLRGELVDEMQGFVLARPLDPETLEAKLLAPDRIVHVPTPPR